MGRFKEIELEKFHDVESIAAHNYQLELCEELYAETQVNSEDFTDWENKFIMNCYSLMKSNPEEFVLSQLQQSKLEEIWELYYGYQDD